MPSGRPTKYTEEMVSKATDYIENYEAAGDVVPQIAGLAIYCGISRETVYDWAKQKDKAIFSDIVKKILAAQEKSLLNGGISGDFNPTITKLLLAKHGYADKQDNTHSAPDGGPVAITYNGVQSDGSR